jgi:surface antigen
MTIRCGRIVLASLGLICIGLSASQAQINPFRSGKQATGMTKADIGMLGDAADHLNNTDPLHVGDAQDWSNPDSGNSGKVTVTRLFQSGGMTCHGMRYDLSYKVKPVPSHYVVNWCKTKSGEWKIKS